MEGAAFRCRAWRFAILAVVSLTLPFRSANAETPQASAPSRPILLAVELGYAFPFGSLERGSDQADVVYGIVPLSVEAGYKLNSRVALVIHGGYAFGIPKLCATASDCEASLGHDVVLAGGARFVLPRLGPVGFQLRATFGYEWFRSELSDSGVSSARDYRGPLLTSLQVSGNLGSDNRSIGLFAALSYGIFSHRELETPAFTTGSLVDRASAHAWLSVGLRGALSF
jgi:hypothetical protein